MFRVCCPKCSTSLLPIAMVAASTHCREPGAAVGVTLASSGISGNSVDGVGEGVAGGVTWRTALRTTVGDFRIIDLGVCVGREIGVFVTVGLGTPASVNLGVATSTMGDGWMWTLVGSSPLASVMGDDCITTGVGTGPVASTVGVEIAAASGVTDMI